MSTPDELPMVEPVSQGILTLEQFGIRLVTAEVTAQGQTKGYVSINSLCDAFGLDNRSQRRKVTDPNSIYRYFAANIHIDLGSGGPQATLCLDALALPFFLAQIQTGRVADQTNAEVLRRFQFECVGILADYFGTGEKGEVDYLQRSLFLASSQQLEFERLLDERFVEAKEAWLAEVDEKLEGARAAFVSIRSEVQRLGGLVTPRERITPEEIGMVQEMVKQLGLLLEERGEHRPYPGIYADIFTLAGVSKTEFIAREKLSPVITFLDERIRAVRKSLQK